MKDKHFTSRMFICAGTLMGISGILIAIGSKIAYGGILFAAAACMFFVARISALRKTEMTRMTWERLSNKHRRD